MSDKKSVLSRRAFIQGTSLGVSSLALLPKAHALSPLPNCHVGFHYQTYTVQDVEVFNAEGDHSIEINYYKAVAYKNGSTSSEKESRYLLCVDVKAGAGYHPVEANAIPYRNTITDIYVFNQSNNELLFWRKMGPNDVAPWAMFIVSESLKALAPKITVVARCSAHGYWGKDFDMASMPTPYATQGVVGTYSSSLLYGGASIMRPYTSATDPDVSKAATGGQGDLGEYHRPNIIVRSDGKVEAFLGGKIADMSGSHGRLADGHYVGGGMLFDQNGNQLGKTEVILFSEAPSKKVLFSGFDLRSEAVKTLRVVMNDTLQGRLMGFLDIA